MIVTANSEIGVSFELPDRLTVDQLDEYQRHMGNYLQNYADSFLSNVRLRAMNYAAAVEAGILSNWHSDNMPDMKPADIGGADARVISFVGQTVEEYITTYTTLPPK